MTQSRKITPRYYFNISNTGPNVSFVSFAVEITPTGTTDIMVVETDLHLNSRHPAYNGGSVQRLIAAAQNYLATNAESVMHSRLVSNRAGEI